MVALSSSTVTTGGVSMVAWAVWPFILVLGFTRAHASINNQYGGDVSGEEVVIDQLKDYLRTHHPRPLPSYHRHPQKVTEKIDFAVTPQDPRYYLSYDPSHADSSSSNTDLLRKMPPDVQQGQEYPGELLQYQDEESRYQPEYPAQFGPNYRQRDVFPPKYLRLPELQYTGAGDLYTEPRRLGPDSQQLDQEEQARLEEKRQQEDQAEDDELLMKKVDDEGKEKKTERKAFATSQPEAVNYMHLHKSEPNVKEPGYTSRATQPVKISDLYFTALVAGCTAVAVCGVIGAGICWYRLNKSHRAAQDAEYPAYGVTGPNKDLSPSSGDRKLAQSAHMYHYQHQKQQMIALEKSSGAERHGSTSDVDSEEEGEENEYTVYECPGLAPTGEMEVKNPLFHDDPTPATPSVRKDADDEEEDEEEEKQRTKWKGTTQTFSYKVILYSNSEEIMEY